MVASSFSHSEGKAQRVVLRGGGGGGGRCKQFWTRNFPIL